MQSGCKDYKPDGIGRRVWIAITELSPKAEQYFDHARIPALKSLSLRERKCIFPSALMASARKPSSFNSTSHSAP